MKIDAKLRRSATEVLVMMVALRRKKPYDKFFEKREYFRCWGIGDNTKSVLELSGIC